MSITARTEDDEDMNQRSRVLPSYSLGFAIRMALTVALTGFVFSRIDLSHFANRLAGTNMAWAAVATVVLSVQIGISGMRWHSIIHLLHGAVPLGRTLRYTWEGAFFSQLLPSAIGGDVVRLWRLHQAGVPARMAATGVFLDRVSALIAVVLATLAALPILEPLLPLKHPVASVLSLVLMGAGGITLLVILDRLVRLPPSWRAARFVHHLAMDARTLLKDPGTSLMTIFLSLLVLAAGGCALFLLALSLQLPLGFLPALAMTPVIILITILPVSVAGWGVRELGMTALLMRLGIPASDAVALSVILGLSILLSTLPGGALWLGGSNPPLSETIRLGTNERDQYE